LHYDVGEMPMGQLGYDIMWIYSPKPQLQLYVPTCHQPESPAHSFPRPRPLVDNSH
jgi:hypothetical protein